jgi:type II secretory pathway pseudopilin PulG
MLRNFLGTIRPFSATAVAAATTRQQQQLQQQRLRRQQQQQQQQQLRRQRRYRQQQQLHNSCSNSDSSSYGDNYGGDNSSGYSGSGSGSRRTMVSTPNPIRPYLITLRMHGTRQLTCSPRLRGCRRSRRAIPIATNLRVLLHTAQIMFRVRFTWVRVRLELLCCFEFFNFG